MAIGPMELNGVISRAQDYSTIKHNEDNKTFVDQTNIQTQFSKEVSNKLHQVSNPDAADKKENHFDSKEKGNGQYSGDGGRNRKKENGHGDKVLTKGKSLGFDIKV